MVIHAVLSAADTAFVQREANRGAGHGTVPRPRGRSAHGLGGRSDLDLHPEGWDQLLAAVPGHADRGPGLYPGHGTRGRPEGSGRRLFELLRGDRGIPGVL